MSEGLETFISEPHKGIACDHVGSPLNMVAAEVDTARQAVTAISHRSPDVTVKEFERVRALAMPEQHPVGLGDVSPKYLQKALVGTYEKPPQDFSALLLQPGVGPKTIRALALIAEVTHGAPLSFRDPVTYTFAVGGKDGWPYPVDRNAYDRSVAFLDKGIREAKLCNKEKLDALRRLDGWSRSVGAGEVRSEKPQARMQSDSLPQPSPLRGEGERSEGEEAAGGEQKTID